MKCQRDCAGCGAAVGIIGRDVCCRCHSRQQAEAARAICPGCGASRVLAAGTGRCETCSRACADCGGPIRRKDRERCTGCHHRHEREQRKDLCPRCGKPGFLRELTGWCGSCSRPGPAKDPPRICAACGELRRHCGSGLCDRCWQKNPQRAFVAAGRLTARLADPPAWLAGFAAAGFGPSRAAGLIGSLGRLLADGEPAHPQALLDRSRLRGRGRSPGTLARTLEAFFTARGLALPANQAGQLAAGRRQRRIDATPGPFRPAAAQFAASRLQARERARRAGTRPRADSTIEDRLAAVRDLAIFLATERGKTDWATADLHDVEAFLAARPANRKSALAGLRQFFAWARTRKLILADPTRGLTAREPRSYRGTTVSLDRQRQLFRRWTTSDVHPHEALTGLLALLHGATCAELRGLTIADIDHNSHAVRLGRRPAPTMLDPASWNALDKSLSHRTRLGTANPHVLVTRQTKSTSQPASAYYLSHVLDPVSVRPQLLRCTRLAELVTTMDPKLVSAAFGMRPEGVLIYLTDHVDPGRLDTANPCNLSRHLAHVHANKCAFPNGLLEVTMSEARS
jgi:site-specific recombinase XerD